MGARRVEGVCIGQRARPVRPHRLKTGADADATDEHLPCHRGCAIHQRIGHAELEPVPAELPCEIIIERLLHDRRLRHAKAAKRARDRAVGVDRHARRAVVGSHVGSGRMDRNTVGDRRPPAGISAGVELALEDHAGDPAVRVGAHRRRHHGRVALGGRSHGLGAVVGDRGRPAGAQCDQPDERLQRQVEL